jgi:nitrogen fixation/metabolism regulation signal transduction histidine kinase
MLRAGRSQFGNTGVRLWFKFNLVMVVAFVVGLGIAGWFTRDIAEATARSQVLHEAALLMHQATAIRGYTSSELVPLLAEQNATRFLPHTVPSWAAQTVLRTMEREFPDYDYKEAALNPTNPADRATDWEADIINAFRRDASVTEMVSERQAATGRILTLARPFRITNEACLTCHSTPAAAPAPMVELYGPNNGFGWRLGEVIGAQIVSVPLRVPLERAQRQLEALLTSLGAVFLAMLVLLNILLHFVVIKPIRQVTAAAERIAAGNLDEPELRASGRDEIGSLARSFNLMRRSLTNAMKLLDA